MSPTITDSVTWQQAELLMQPAFIRIVDNIRKHLDASPWKGTYHDVLIWPRDTTEEVKSLVTGLLQALETATAEKVEHIKGRLADLPTPYPGYHLRLQLQEQEISIDLWELCYQVCFSDYIPGSVTVHIDSNLISLDGEVDWQQLENKTKNLVAQVFADLPEVG